jgi:hypothetical protein
VYHKTYWTADKIASRLRLIEEERLVYRQKAAIPAFLYRTLPDPMTPPILGAAEDRSAWKSIQPPAYWGSRFTNFMLHTSFTVPADWDVDAQVALYLPLGERATSVTRRRWPTSTAKTLRHRRPPPPGDSLPAPWCDGARA